MRLRASLAARPVPNGPMVTVSEPMASKTGPTRSMTVGVAADHAHQVAGGRGVRPAGDPAVEHGHPEGGGLGADGLDARCRDGAHDDEGGAGTGGGQPAVGTGQHGVDLLVVDHGHHHHVGPTDQVGRRRRPPWPSRRSASVASARTSHTTRGSPARSTLVATPSPMAPRPMTPTVGGRGSGPVGWLVVRHWTSPCRSLLSLRPPELFDVRSVGRCMARLGVLYGRADRHHGDPRCGGRFRSPVPAVLGQLSRL